MSDLVQKVDSAIKRENLLARGQSLLVAVSGGVDSMVLLQVLHELAAKHRWKLVVAHFNHQLRGRASDGDERFVRAAAERLKLKCVAGRGDVRAFARKNKLSVEMAARALRHRFLAGAARRLKTKSIATAHHADDQVELFFLRLLRGAGSAGLGGMSASAPSPANAKVRLIRPLLEISKANLLAFAQARRIKFREDASNASLDFQRNRIRHELLPLLRKNYQPALDRAVLRVMDIVREEGRCVRAAAEQWLKRGKAGSFSRLPVAVQRQVLQSQLFALGVEPDFEMIEHLRAGAGAMVTIAPRKIVVRDARGRISQREMPPEPAAEKSVWLDFTGPRGVARVGGAKLHWEIAPFNGASGQLPKFSSRQEFFDADKVGGRIGLRHWRPGDRFQPIGMKQAVKLQDLFTNLKVPRAARHRRWLAATESGVIIWVEGLRMGEQFKLDKTTRRGLKWQWSRGVRSK